MGVPCLTILVPMLIRLALMDTEADRTVLVPACHMGDIPASINKNGLHFAGRFLSDDFYLRHIVVLLLLKHDFQKAILIDGFCSFAFD